jgi:CHAT domain-containing protein
MREALRTDVAARAWEQGDEEPSVSAAGVGRGAAASLAARSSVGGGKTKTLEAPPISAEDADRVLRRLHAVTLRPVERWLPRDPEHLVTIVPDGPLFLVSFAALADNRGRYCIERHTLSYTPSIGVLRYTARDRTPAAAAEPRILVVGNPAMPLLPGRQRRPPALPGAVDEARAIRGFYSPSQVTTLTGASAGERRVRELAPDYAMIHFATHGYIRDDEPLESLLALAADAAASDDASSARRGEAPPHSLSTVASGDASSTAGDGLLTVREVSELSLDARLVVLSACNSGLGRITGDGVMGLARAFLSAGSRSVLASLWRVSDSVASSHMEQFYRALTRNGARPAAALRMAQLGTIRGLRLRLYRTPSGEPLPSLPVFWASFVLIGEPDAGSDQRSASRDAW